MRYLMVFGFVVFGCMVSGQTDTDMPAYEEVVTRFFEKYAEQGDQMTFQKKPAGWFISIEKYEQGKISEVFNEAFWNAETQTYQDLDLNQGMAEFASKQWAEKYLNSWQTSHYEICPYYGYDGWDWDVIQAYKESNIQEDTLLYALGRAYSSYATHLLSDQYGYAVRSNQFDLGAGRNALSEDQLAEYRKYRHQAIHTYQQLAESSPDFQTIVGPISNKVANEHMVAYFDLWMFQNEEEALKELKADLYDVYYLSLAKNYLSSCAPNAILFTGGDNDTYPLLYVQKKLGYRPDVSVVNVSFMNVRRYIHALRNTTPVVNFTLTDESYADDGPNAYLLVDNQIDKVISADKFIEMIGQEHPALRRDIGNSFYHAIPSKQLRVQVDSAKIEELKNDLTESLQQVFTPGLELIITRSGIEKKDLAFLDLLIANQWERPVYFNYTSKNLLGFVLNNRTVQEGMTYRLFPINSYDAVNHERMYDYFLNQFSWDFGNRSENREGGFISNYRGAINNLVEALIEANENDKALEILTLSLMKMPHEKFPYNYFNAIQVKFLIQLHQMEKAKNLARVLKQDCVQSLRAVSEGSHKSQNFIVEKLAILSTLGKVFQDINETKLANEYLSALQTYQDLRR